MASASVAASFVLLLALTVSNTRGTVVFSSCPNPGSQDSFDVNQYLGKWYELERFSAIFELGVICGSAEYSLNDDGSIKVINGGKRRILGIESPTSVTGKATVPDSSRPSELRVSFSRFDPGTGPANYFVVDTDYTTYTVVFSCTDLVGPFSIQYAWILTRERGVAPGNLAALKSNLESHGVRLSNFNHVDQSDCEGY